MGDDMGSNKSDYNSNSSSRRWLHGYHIATLVMFIIMVQMAVLMYWSLWPYNIFYFTQPLKVDNDFVVAGGSVHYEMSYCKSQAYQDYAAEVQLLYVNQQIIYTPSWTQFIEPGCRTESIIANIPELPPGRYKLILYREYRINPVRTLRSSSESNYFEVITAEEYKKRLGLSPKSKY